MGKEHYCCNWRLRECGSEQEMQRGGQERIVFIARWLLCALCSSGSEEIGSTSHATPFPKGEL